MERHDGFDNKPVEVVVEKPPVVAPPPKAVVLKPAPTPAPAKPEELLTKPFITAPAVVAKPPQERAASLPQPTPKPNAMKRFGSSVKKLFGN